MPAGAPIPDQPYSPNAARRTADLSPGAGGFARSPMIHRGARSSLRHPDNDR